MLHSAKVLRTVSQLRFILGGVGISGLSFFNLRPEIKEKI